LGKGGRVSAAPLSAFSAAEIVKHYATRAGLDPASFAVRSLRAGFPTRAAGHGASVFKMMRVSRHRSVALRAPGRSVQGTRWGGVPVDRFDITERREPPGVRLRLGGGKSIRRMEAISRFLQAAQPTVPLSIPSSVRRMAANGDGLTKAPRSLFVLPLHLCDQEPSIGGMGSHFASQSSGSATVFAVAQSQQGLLDEYICWLLHFP
jgi:hypothetical protein